METSTTSTDNFDSSKSLNSNDNKSDNLKTWIYILIFIALFVYLYSILSKSAEHMSGGTAQQMQSLDGQDIYLSGGPMGSTDVLASGNYLYHWNMSTRNGGNRANWSPIPINNNLKKSQNNSISVNVPGILSPADNTVFPRVIPTSTVSPYPNINNILVNQKEDNDLMEKELSNEILNDTINNNIPKSTMRSDALNTLQNALMNTYQNCPVSQNSRMSHPKADSVASNKVDAQSVGDLSDGTEYMTIENFDSGITFSLMPTRVHNQIKKKMVKRQENFDSGVSSTTGRSHNSMPSKVHKKLVKKMNKKHENFNGMSSTIGSSSQSIPNSVHENLSNKLVKKNQVFAKVNDDNDDVENFDSGMSSLYGMRTTTGLPSSNMSIKVYNKLNARINAKSNNKLIRRQENFDSGMSSGMSSTTGMSRTTMPSKVHKKLVKRVIKKQENFGDNSGDDSDDNQIIYFVDEVNDGNENMVRNPLRADTNRCENCPQGRCVNCPMRNNRTNECPDCPLGYPCKTCGIMKFLDDRDQIVDSDEIKEGFTCPCKRNLILATDLKQKKFPNDLERFQTTNTIKKKGVKDLLNDNLAVDDRDLFTPNINSKENFECSLNPHSNECNSCSRCASCKNGNCPTCPKNENIKENFESSVGFGTPCPCGRGGCANCPLCRAGNCPNCPKVKPNSTYIDLASLSNWHGGSRLGTDWNDATKGPAPVNIGNSVTYYPDSYLGSYFINPKPDIVYPYAVIPPSRTVAGLNVDFN
jgi:hypothetical protein